MGTFFPNPAPTVAELVRWLPTHSPPEGFTGAQGEVVFSSEQRTAPAELILWVFELDHRGVSLPCERALLELPFSAQSVIHPAAPHLRYPPWAILVWRIYQQAWLHQRAWARVFRWAAAAADAENWPDGDLRCLLTKIDGLPAFHLELTLHAATILPQGLLSDGAFEDYLGCLQPLIRRSPISDQTVLADTSFAAMVDGPEESLAIATVLGALSEPQQGLILVPWASAIKGRWAAVRFHIPSSRYTVVDPHAGSEQLSPEMEAFVHRTGRAIDNHLGRCSIRWAQEESAMATHLPSGTMESCAVVYNSLERLICPSVVPWDAAKAGWHRGKMFMALVGLWETNGRPLRWPGRCPPCDITTELRRFDDPFTEHSAKSDILTPSSAIASERSARPCDPRDAQQPSTGSSQPGRRTPPPALQSRPALPTSLPAHSPALPLPSSSNAELVWAIPQPQHPGPASRAGLFGPGGADGLGPLGAGTGVTAFARGHTAVEAASVAEQETGQVGHVRPYGLGASPFWPSADTSAGPGLWHGGIANGASRGGTSRPLLFADDTSGASTAAGNAGLLGPAAMSHLLPDLSALLKTRPAGWQLRTQTPVHSRSPEVLRAEGRGPPQQAIGTVGEEAPNQDHPKGPAGPSGPVLHAAPSAKRRREEDSDPGASGREARPPASKKPHGDAHSAMTLPPRQSSEPSSASQLGGNQMAGARSIERADGSDGDVASVFLMRHLGGVRTKVLLARSRLERAVDSGDCGVVEQCDLLLEQALAGLKVAKAWGHDAP
ncbi:uncharacterized protein BXZ73DRAFT_83152 [Epithele typhae]|uniref:uncharacterized protein n=1 Tax=Epithele typhae TaxID=378194 RepID=UPI0020084FC4|nr:uncharacterized protein BXZ73DRAFT_83152 [Epithele typhae]KAH9910830.1 hypothetical protein BXZ73DRAFT_83152 [Epithele typhae]